MSKEKPVNALSVLANQPTPSRSSRLELPVRTEAGPSRPVPSNGAAPAQPAPPIPAVADRRRGRPRGVGGADYDVDDLASPEKVRTHVTFTKDFAQDLRVVAEKLGRSAGFVIERLLKPDIEELKAKLVGEGADA